MRKVQTFEQETTHMRLTELQTDMLKILQSIPKLTREFVRKYQSEYEHETIKANLTGLIDAGLVDVDQDDMHRLTPSSYAWFEMPRSVAAPRQFTNASTNGTWTGHTWTPARPGADDHFRHKSLVGRPTGVIA